MRNQTKPNESVLDRVGSIIHLSVVFVAVSVAMAAANFMENTSLPEFSVAAWLVRIVALVFLGLELVTHIRTREHYYARPSRELVYRHLRAEGWCLLAGFVVMTVLSPRVFPAIATAKDSVGPILVFTVGGCSIAFVLTSLIALLYDLMRLAHRKMAD